MAGESTAAGILVRPGLVIPEAEIHLRFTRSSGPGGQNVNKVATRVELEFDVTASRVLEPDEKARLLTRLGRRVSSAGVVRVVGQRFRSQSRNEADARQRLALLLAAALAIPRRRRKTRPTVSARQTRMADKRRRAAVKSVRRPVRGDED